MIDVLELPFDQYQRYRLVSDLIEEVRPAKRALRVLDVGGRTALLRAFLPGDEVVLVDLEASGEPGLVLGDGSKLPFRDASFDVVAAFDTLEHVPVASRAAFVAECMRVARAHVVLAGPYDSPEVVEAERILQRFLKDKLQVEHRYLDEHRHHGLPRREAVEAQLAKLGARVVSIGHGNLDRWLVLLCMSMYMDYRPELRGIAARFHRFYNRSLYDSDSGEPVYRHAVVAALGRARLPKVRAATPARAPAGATAKVRDLAVELVDLERVREGFDEERKRLLETQAVLRADLAGHKQRLAELERSSGEQRTVIESLTADLAGHKRSKADLERDLGLERQRFATFEREHAQLRATLERDLEQRRAHAATLAADLGAHKSVVDELRERSGALEGELAKLRELRDTELAASRALQAELAQRRAEHAQVAAALGADLDGHKATLAALRADLQVLRVDGDALRAEQARLVEELERNRVARDELERSRAPLEAALGELREAKRALESELAGTRKDAADHRRAAQDERQHFERELAEHRKVLAELSGERDQQRTVIATLGADLAEHRKVLAALEGELAAHRTALATLEKDLAGHRRVIGDQRLELEQRRATETHLRGEVAHVYGLLASAQEELERTASTLRLREAQIADLRAAVAHRWENLKRVFTRKPTFHD